MAQALKQPGVIDLQRPRRRRVNRFTLAYLLLGLLVAGAGVAAWLAATGPAKHANTRTALTPAQTAGLGTYALKSIAFRVQNEYHLGDGSALAAIVARPSDPPQFMTTNGPVAISVLIVHTGFAIENVNDTKAFDVSKAALFVMCGAAAGCAIPGTPSVARGAYLDREVLELTLRTLQSLSSVDSVLTFIPPGSTKRVVYLTRGDLSKQLGEPLAQALSMKGLGGFVTAHTFALNGVSPLPDGSAYLSASPAG